MDPYDIAECCMVSLKSREHLGKLLSEEENINASSQLVNGLNFFYQAFNIMTSITIHNTNNF